MTLEKALKVLENTIQGEVLTVQYLCRFVDDLGISEKTTIVVGKTYQEEWGEEFEWGDEEHDLFDDILDNDKREFYIYISEEYDDNLIICVMDVTEIEARHRAAEEEMLAIMNEFYRESELQ